MLGSSSIGSTRHFNSGGPLGGPGTSCCVDSHALSGPYSEMAVGLHAPGFEPLLLEAIEEGGQLRSVELPLKRPGLPIRQGLIEAEPLFDLLQAGEVVGRQDLPLNQRDVDLHLVE